ncbi:MAG: hypothetical protein ACE15F_21280 [bacterium]
MSKRLDIDLESDAGRSFAGHLVRAAFVQSVAIDSGANRVPVNREISAPVDAEGKAVLEFPDDIALEVKIRLRVLSPDGQVLREEEVSPDLLGSGQPVVIKVNAKEYFPIEPNTDPAFGKPARIRGLVVDPSGKGRTGGRQVVIRARPLSPEEAAWQVVAVARTDGRGYFSAEYPLGHFKEAQGEVDGGGPTPVPLNDDGGFPERVVLGMELAGDESPEKEKCPCEVEVPRDPDAEDLVNASGTFSADTGAGHCVDITKPNRVLEEFDYYTVVRTTEPDIRDLTISDPPKISVRDVIRILDPKIYTHLLRTQPAEALLSTRPAAAPQAELSTSAALTRTAAYRREPEIIDPADPETLAAHALVTMKPELEHLSEVIGLTSLRVAAKPSRDPSPAPRPEEDGIDLDAVRLDAELVKTLARDPDGFSLTRLAQAEIATRKNDLIRLLDLMRRRGGRNRLTCSNPVDWDDEPTIYQACTIAHGHILHFKQQWCADGYSFGDLLYSLPLAPCQKKQIAVIDWDRRESAARLESLEEQEQLSAFLSRDRDISEIANASVRESLSGGSEASSSSFGGGLGIGAIIGPVGGLLGIGGGTSGASSSAWQNSARNSAASSMQQLRDHTVQGASAVRSQRSTVIQTVRQGETMRVQTEVVANHNHCHAITIEYFEVLRHFLVRHQLADVQECLLVPLLMSRFDSAKALRWRDPLSLYLRDRRLARGFDALQRITDNYVGSDMPVGAYAEEELTYLDGYFRIQFRIQRPRDNDDGTFLAASWGSLSWLGISPHEWWQNYLHDQQERDRIFAEELGPRIAEEITNGLRIYAVDENDNETRLPVDPTLVSDFQNDTPLYVSLRLNDALPPLRRDRIKFIKIDTTIDTNAGPQNIDAILPAGSKIIVHSGQMGYRTEHIAHDLFKQSRILNDLSGTDGVLIYSPLSRQELRRPRQEDKEYATRLLKHLNDFMEYYHRAIWWRMDAQRRYLLLDGFIAPNSGGRSVASVVENRLVGIVGNCLVMPVARGFHLDPTFQQDEDNPIDLLEHYQPTTLVAPLRLTVPTKGVFAESVMGACNSCEKKEESRFWRWEESPCPDEPTPIQPVSTESRRAEPPSLTPQPFPQPIVAFQNVPNAPDPQGFGALTQLLSNPNLFRDITGLTENQRNALAALQSALGTAQFFGGKAADLALQGNMRQDIDKALDKINEQHQAGAITDQQRQQLTEAALRGMIGGGTQAPAQPMTTGDIEHLTNTAGANQAAVSVSRPGGETVSVNAQPTDALLDQLNRTLIILSPAENAADSRAFFPSRQDKSGVIELAATIRNAPDGATHRWTRPNTATLKVDSPGALRTRVRGVVPGVTQLDFAVHDSSGTKLASVKLQLSVPQFVTIDEEAAAFDAVLTAMHLDTLKNDVLQLARQVCDQLLSTSNVRTIWRVGPFTETVPAHIPAAHITTLTLRGDPPAGSPGMAGRTPVPAGAGVLNEAIDIFPGAFDNFVPQSDINTEVLALLIQIESQGMTPALQTLLLQIVGRLLGLTMAHEIIHSLLAFDIPTGHNNPAIPGDIMNNGFDFTFTECTGFEDTAHQSPVDPANFVDHGVGSMAKLQATNQGLMDARFPVPPAFV